MMVMLYNTMWNLDKLLMSGGGFEQWLDFVLQEGYELFDYEGNDK